MRKHIQLPSISNVAAGSTATLSLPVGLTYECITLKYAGVTAAQIKNIELRVNGKPIQMFKDGDELNKLNGYYGHAGADGYLHLWQVTPWAKGQIIDPNTKRLVWACRLTALGTMEGVSTVTLHMEIDAAASAPVITAHAIQAEPQRIGMIRKVRAYPASFATTGEQEIDNIPRSGARIAAIHLVKADVSKVSVDVDSIRVRDESKELGSEWQTRSGRYPQSTYMTTCDFCMDGDLENAMRTKGVQDFRVRPTLDTSGALRTVVEYLDYGLAGL